VSVVVTCWRISSGVGRSCRSRAKPQPSLAILTDRQLAADLPASERYPPHNSEQFSPLKPDVGPLVIRHSLNFLNHRAESFFPSTGFRVPRVHQVFAKADEGQLFAAWCQQRRLVGLPSYNDSFVVADDHRPVLESWATPRGLGSGSSLSMVSKSPTRMSLCFVRHCPKLSAMTRNFPRGAFLSMSFVTLLPPALCYFHQLQNARSALSIGAKITTRSDRMRW